jgi:hypothetical protein
VDHSWFFQLVEPVFFHIRFFSISFPRHCATPPRCLAAEPPSRHAFLE